MIVTFCYNYKYYSLLHIVMTRVDNLLNKKVYKK